MSAEPRSRHGSTTRWTRTASSSCATRRALAAIDEIAGVDGIDAAFIGPSDLAADFGHLGNAGHPEVQDAIATAIARCREQGRTIGILAPVAEDARHYIIPRRTVSNEVMGTAEERPA